MQFDGNGSINIAQVPQAYERKVMNFSEFTLYGVKCLFQNFRANVLSLSSEWLNLSHSYKNICHVECLGSTFVLKICCLGLFGHPTPRQPLFRRGQVSDCYRK